MQDAPRRRSASPVTILFADISGSTSLYAQRGDTVAFSLVSNCIDILEAQVSGGGGRLVKRVGDGILAVFEQPADAVLAAAAMQDALEKPGTSLHVERIRVRVGISTGTAVIAEGDVFGDVVNVAARLVSIAGAGDIFLSGKAYEALPAELRQAVRLIDQLALRGRPSQVLVYQYLRQPDDLTQIIGVRTRAYAAALEVTYRTSLFVLGPERGKLTIGRAPDNDITIERDIVSRHHAEIVLRGDIFVLVDRSANGTYVYSEGGNVARISRDETPLSGSGRIHPGSDGTEPIRYQGGPR